MLNVIENGIYYKYELVMNKIWRKDWYVQRFFSLADYAKEIRLTKVAMNIENVYESNKVEERRVSGSGRKDMI